MTNHQIAVTTSPLVTSSRYRKEIREALNRKIGRVRRERLWVKVREGIEQCLATLAVSAILLLVTYLFLAQLADGGW